jgi:hypothetical protein
VDGELGLSGSVPLLSQIPFPFPVAAGGGLRATFHYDFTGAADVTEPGNEHLLGAHDVTVDAYLKAGELDMFRGPAYEIALRLDGDALLDVVRSPAGVITSLSARSAPVAQVTELLDGLEVRTRLAQQHIGGLTSQFADTMENRRKLSVLLRNNGKIHSGLVCEGYLDLRHRVPGDLFADLLVAAYDDIVNHEGRGAAELGDWLLRYLQHGYPPEHRPESVARIIAAFDLVSAVVHLEAGYGFAGGFHLKAVGGLRLRLASSGALVVRHDVTQDLRDLALGGTRSLTYRRISDHAASAYRFVFTDPAP